MNKFLLIYFTFIFCAFNSFSQKYYSGPAGNWCTDPGGKGDCVNTPGDKAELVVEHTITLRGPYSSKGKIKITKEGKLTVSNAQSGNLEVQGVLEVEEGGMLIVQKELVFRNKSNVDIDQRGSVLVSGDFLNANNSTDVKIDGTLEVGSNFENANNAKIQGNGKITIAGSCKNSGSVFGISNTCSGIKNLTLPVDLLFFEAKVSGNAVQLSWATAVEENFDYFIVERSSNAKNFIPVGEKISGRGNTTQISNYSFLDENPLSGRSYYRLKAIDFDGTVEYHPIATVLYSGNSDVKIFPNPTRGNNIHVSVTSKPSINNRIKIYNIIGEMVFVSKVQSGTNEYHFDKPLEPGLYIVIFEDGSNKHQMKLTVQ